MKEVKPPKKPLAIYYAIVLVILLVLNFVHACRGQVSGRSKKWTTAPFMSMTEEKEHRPGGH